MGDKSWSRRSPDSRFEIVTVAVKTLPDFSQFINLLDSNEKVRPHA